MIIVIRFLREDIEVVIFLGWDCLYNNKSVGRRKEWENYDIS